MNKLISDLAESCMIEEYNQHGNLIEDGFDYGKFAELIVRECSNMAEAFHRCQYDFTGDLELHEFMRKHFGVE